MNDHQIKRESSDTFGRNVKADLELLRRINERANDRSEEIFALAVMAAAIACVCGIAGVIAYSILS
jgi:hypothetical protein